jgi:predicted nucleic acid-binding protein
MKSVFVDTNIIIDFTKGHNRQLQPLLKLQQHQQVELCTNPVVIAEFFTDKNLTTASMFKQARDFFSFFRCLPIDNHIGLLAGQLLRRYRLVLGDGLIAATCLAHHLLLATQNTRHFRSVKGLKFYRF